MLAAWDAPEDATTGARYDLRAVVEDVQLYIRRGCVPALIARRGKTGRRVLLTFDDPQKRRRAQVKANAWNQAPYYYGVDQSIYTVS